LVEVLIALVVLAVGMLGIAALYVESLRSARTALLRSQAIVLATDMGDRIRSNLAARASYTKGADDAGTVTTACETAATGCTSQQMAAHDIARWHQAVDSRLNSATSLPGGRGTIVVAAPSGGGLLWTYTISVTWDETNQTASNSYVLRIEA